MGHIQKTRKNCHVVFPSGKPMLRHLRRCQGFAVAYYGFTLDALDLAQPLLSLNQGLIFLDS
jgi:hypothetical protein